MNFEIYPHEVRTPGNSHVVYVIHDNNDKVRLGKCNLTDSVSHPAKIDIVNKLIKQFNASSDLYFACRAALLTLEDDEHYYKCKEVVETIRNAIKKAE